MRGLSYKGNEYAVTAIVSTYNSEFYIANCLRNLLNQTISDHIEIIVVDSGSTQAEASIVRNFQNNHRNIKYLRTERETIYSAWNRGARAAKGKYITNSNTDDVLRSDGLERLVIALEANPDAVLAYGNCLVTAEPNQTHSTAISHMAFTWPDFEARTLFQCCYVGPQPIWRRDVHDRYGYFDEHMITAGDYDFWLRLAVKERFFHVDEFLGTYLLAPSSIEHTNQDRSLAESTLGRERNWPSEWGPLPPVAGYYLRPFEIQPSMKLDSRVKSPIASVILFERRAASTLEMLSCRNSDEIEAVIIGSTGVPTGILEQYGTRVSIKAIYIPGVSDGEAINLAKMLAEGRFVY